MPNPHPLAGQRSRPAPGAHRRDGPPRPKVVETSGVLPLAAAPARPRRRHRLAAASFALFVLLPTLATGLYLWFFAADRYASRLAFSIRAGEAPPAVELLGAVAQLGGSNVATDGQVLYDFIQSQEIVETVRARLPLEDYWNRAPRDVVFALGRDRSIEDLVRYWNRMVDVALDPVTGILAVEVRAFAPGEARAIAAAILAASTELVDRLSERARADAVRFAALELAEAEARLRDIRARLRQFRDRAQEVDPAENARAAVGLVAGLEEELAAARVELRALRSALDPSAPRIVALERRIAALEGRIAAERTRLGAGETRSGRPPLSSAGSSDATTMPLSRVVGEFEELSVDREFAERAYTVALAGYQQAEAEARRRNRYLVPHITPTLAETAEYPDRPFLLAAVFMLTVTAWAILMLGAWNLRDRN